MLLFIEPSRVEAVRDTEQREANIRQEFLGGLADGEGQELDDSGAEGYARLTDHEQLIDECHEDDEAHPNDPSPDGTNGHRWIIVRIDDGSNLGVGAVAREQSDFDLGLANGASVLIWLLEMVRIADELFEMF